MGSPVSPIVANLYMEAFEERVLCNYHGRVPRLWLRYVDDTFVILHKDEQVSFFNYINSVDSNIKFTQEECRNRSLPFLDCLVSVDDRNQFQTKVYRKSTHTDHYLQFESNHPLIHKLGVIRTLNHRAATIISDPVEADKELDHLESALRKCGYPNWSFIKADYREPRATRPKDISNRPPVRVTIPYVKGVSERLKKTFKQFGFTVTHKPFNTLRSQLVRVKDKPQKEKKSNVVYGVRCRDRHCTDSYVGETKQSLKSRMSQHRRPSYGDNYDSAVFSHLEATGHHFDISDVVILDREEDWFRRGVKESIYERVEKPTLNKSGGLRHQLSHVWDRAFKEFPRRLSRDSSCDLSTHSLPAEAPVMGAQRRN